MRIWICRILTIQLLIGAIWFGWPFLKSARTQAVEQQLRLVDLVSHRNWRVIPDLLAEDYRDGWQMNREEAVALGHELFHGFLLLDLKWTTSSVVLEPGKTVVISGSIKADGAGQGLSQEVISRVNRLRQPFVFVWRKDGWKPRDWRLVSVNQAELEQP